MGQVDIKRYIFLIIYYCFARYLPPSYSFMGGIWKWVRYQACKNIFHHCGKNVNVEIGAYFSGGRGIVIGDHSGIGRYCRINGKVTIGSNVMMGPHITIYTQNHNFSRTDIPMINQGFTQEEPVVIADDVWIGSHVIILPGVRVGHGSVIGAGSVVTKDVPAWTVTAGNPAKVVTSRVTQ